MMRDGVKIALDSSHGRGLIKTAKERLSREAIAMRIAKEFFDGVVVNLGTRFNTRSTL